VFLCHIVSGISDLLVSPLQERMDDWKKAVVLLDREHARGKLTSQHFTCVFANPFVNYFQSMTSRLSFYLSKANDSNTLSVGREPTLAI